MIFILLLIVLLVSCSASDMNVTIVSPSNVTLLDSVKEVCFTSPNRKKTVGVFGGSLSCNPESENAKTLWKQHLGMQVTSYGHGGHGFSLLQGSIQDQVNAADTKDVYILWASTNDYTSQRLAGNVTDYTEADNYNEKNRETQCGGINYCIKTLREKNPQAKIYLFGSLPFFATKEGFIENSQVYNSEGLTFYQFVELQRQCAEAQNIPFLDQFHIPILSTNIGTYYKSDLFHMTEQGYADIGVYQLYFLATEKELKK